MSKICFFIAPIGKENSEIRKRSDQIFSYVIKPAAKSLGYEAIRGDHIHQPGIINAQVIEHLNDEIAIADLTGNNPNVYYELAIRHGVNKPVINIKDGPKPLAFDVVGMRTINVDFRYIDDMKKCRKEIIKQIQAIENDSTTDNPITMTKQAKLMDESISGLKRIGSKIESLKQKPTSKNKLKIKNLTDAYNSKILQAIKDLPKTKRIKGQSKERLRNSVLWVDDYPANNKAIMDVYRRLGVEFDMALDTEQALERLSKQRYDLIISDIGRHPQQDAGIKMIHEIKKKFTKVAPIIVYSADSAVKKYGTNAINEGASLATSSARDLVLKMNEILNLE